MMPGSSSKPQRCNARSYAHLRGRGAGLLLLAGLLGSMSAVARAQTHAEAWFDAPTNAPIETRVELALPRGEALSARIQVPRGAGDEAPLPAVMLFGGLQRGEAVLDLIDSGRPKVLASFDYPLRLPEDVRGWRRWRYLPAARHAIHDTLAAIGGLYRHLAARPGVDRGRITIVGVSLGAPFAVIAAAEHDIPGLAVIHGFGSVDAVIAHQFGRRWSKDRGDWVWLPARLLGRLLNWYARIPSVDDLASQLDGDQRAWMLSATDDHRLPRAATANLREAFEQSQAQFSFTSATGGHLRGEDDPRIPGLLQQVEAWMIEHDLH